jgi:energy-coupling factor transport system permease protein
VGGGERGVDVSDAFSSLHPAAGYLFFGSVTLFTVAFLNPVTLVVSFACATAYAVYIRGRKAVRFSLFFLLPVMIIAAVVNPAFNHRGATILFYLPDGNPFTLESVLYGTASALMVGAVIQWFYCYSAMMSSDKFLWLFGRVIPALSLVISIALRLLPRYVTQTRRVAAAQRGIGVDVTSGSLLGRVRSGLLILSVMTTWALENGIDTADSMNSRGYGLRGRTAYSNYRVEGRDRTMLVFLGVAMLVVAVVAWGVRGAAITFFPLFAMDVGSPEAIVLYVCWTLICASPLVLGLREDALWRSLRSRA